MPETVVNSGYPAHIETENILGSKISLGSGASEEEQDRSTTGTDSSEPIQVSHAGSFEQLCQAFHLVHQLYVASGYIEPNKSRLRYSIHQLLPVSKTFVAVKDKMIVGTVSLVIDSSGDLPCGSIFTEELNKLRSEERSIAEGTMFACGQMGKEKNSLITVDLLRLIFDWSGTLGLDDIVVVANPKHVIFWERMIGFERLGEVKDCCHVKGADGVFLRFDLRGVLEGTKELTRTAKRFFVSNWEERATWQSEYRLREEDAVVLLQMHPELLREASSTQRTLFARHYPMALSILEKKQWVVDKAFSGCG